MKIATVLSEIDNRVSHQLARAVVGHVPATTGLKDRQVPLPTRILVPENVRPTCPTTEGQDMGMFDKEEGIRYVSRLKILHSLGLKFLRSGILQPAQEMKLKITTSDQSKASSKFSRVLTTCAMN